MHGPLHNVRRNDALLSAAERRGADRRRDTEARKASLSLSLSLLSLLSLSLSRTRARTHGFPACQLTRRACDKWYRSIFFEDMRSVSDDDFNCKKKKQNKKNDCQVCALGQKFGFDRSIATCYVFPNNNNNKIIVIQKKRLWNFIFYPLQK